MEELGVQKEGVTVNTTSKSLSVIPQRSAGSIVRYTSSSWRPVIL